MANFEVPRASPAAAGMQIDNPPALPAAWLESREARDRFRSLIPGLLGLNATSTAVGLCSTLPQEGTSTIVAGLACAAAEGHLKTAIVDAASAGPGHASLWSGVVPDHAPDVSADVLRAIEIVGVPRVRDEIPSSRLKRVLEDARPRARVVLVDLEPVKTSSQVLSLAGSLDAVYLVVEAERERREVIAWAIHRLSRAGLQVGGVILNKRVRRIPDFLYRWL